MMSQVENNELLDSPSAMYLGKMTLDFSEFVIEGTNSSPDAII